MAKRFEVGIKFRGEAAENAWDTKFREYEAAYPELAAEYKAAFANKPVDVTLEDFEIGTSLASRSSSQQAIQQISAQVPSFWGGSADLSASNNTMVKVESDFQPDNYAGRNIWFGVREFAMGCSDEWYCSFMVVLVFYGGTFFVFSNYLLPAVRMAALQNLPVTYVYDTRFSSSW